jgi:hypothetical protein
MRTNKNCSIPSLASISPADRRVIGFCPNLWFFILLQEGLALVTSQVHRIPNPNCNDKYIIYNCLQTHDTTLTPVPCPSEFLINTALIIKSPDKP